jgi:hypothetical protein
MLLVPAQERRLVGVAEIGYMLDVTRARVSQLVAKDDFPTAEELRMGKVWWIREFRAWAAARGRILRELPDTWPIAPDERVEGAPLRAGNYKRTELAAAQEKPAPRSRASSAPGSADKPPHRR